MAETRHYINLANGLDFVEHHNVTDPRFIRIQSTWCEQKRWGPILDDLDYGFLLDLALGNTCVVYDCGAHRQESRALWQGIPWIRYTLQVQWLREHNARAFVKQHNVTMYFSDCFRDLSSRTLKRLDYVWKFGNTDTISLETAAHITEHDGDYDHWRDVLAV